MRVSSSTFVHNSQFPSWCIRLFLFLITIGRGTMYHQNVADFLLFSFTFAVEGIIGLSRGFGLPLFDVIRGTVVDHMHCVCEGVIHQLIL